MEKPDNQIIRQVWERVQHKPQPTDIPDLTPVLTGLRQEAVFYQWLIKNAKSAAYQTLAKQVNSHIACIKGMIRLTGTSAEDFAPPQPRQEPVLSMLRKAYANALGRLTEYEKRTSDSTFGPVFHILAAETRNTLRTLSELCGMIH